MQSKRIILASSSPRRRELLASLGLKFDVVRPDVDESARADEEAGAHALRLACEKARLAARSAGDSIVIGADTVVELDSAILGKPTDEAEAMEMLKALGGRTHSVITAFAVIDASTGAEIKGLDRTLVTFKALADDEIKRYVATGEPMDKAGAYAVQGIGAFMIEKVEGSYTNVVGLPLERLSEVFKSIGVAV